MWRCQLSRRMAAAQRQPCRRQQLPLPHRERLAAASPDDVVNWSVVGASAFAGDPPTQACKRFKVGKKSSPAQPVIAEPVVSEQELEDHAVVVTPAAPKATPERKQRQKRLEQPRAQRVGKKDVDKKDNEPMGKAKLFKLVWKGERQKTGGGVKREDLIKSKLGKIVTKRQSNFGQRAFKANGLDQWVHCMLAARKDMGVTSFLRCKQDGNEQEVELYKRTLDKFTSVRQSMQQSNPGKNGTKSASDSDVAAANGSAANGSASHASADADGAGNGGNPSAVAAPSAAPSVVKPSR